jgi:hypothetical protein
MIVRYKIKIYTSLLKQTMNKYNRKKGKNKINTQHILNY